MATLPGLSDREVRDRQLAGETNNAKLPTSRSYARILQENLLTFVNAVFFAISGVFILLRRPSDAIFVAVVIFSGVVIGIVQEIWAKQKLDEIALLSRPHATVIRNGEEINIDPCEIVLGDTLVLRPGDQVLVDGQIVGEGRVEIDESLLTGESDLIAKVAEKPVYSGSFCVSGIACYEAQKVGADTVAYQLTMGAREFRQVYTPLQAEINLIIRILLLLASFLWLLIGISFVSRSQTLNEVVQRAAVIAGLIPAGLLLAITLSYAMGSIRMLGQNVLIQQTNAVESLSNVDVLCLDKTGTLTTNQIELHSIYPIDISETELRSQLGNFAASTQAGNRTSEALLIGCSGYAKPIQNEISFSSARKWSAIEFADQPGTYVLGAPEILMKSSKLDGEILEYIDRQVNQGFRVVLFAHTPKSIESSTLPELTPLGILCFSDQLRPSARETLQGFAKAGITLKIISGDNPQTVAALARQAEFSDEIRVISGAELAQMDQAQFVQAARNYNVFGRITPQQKAQLVRSLRSSGHYVAMTGDGVNDVLSLKQANLGIAMESGSKATRSIADIVLLNDSFEALPHTFLEGQRIQNGIRDVVKLFMVRLCCVALLIFAIAIVSDSFPLLNKHSAVVTLIGVGIPTTFIPIWAQPGEPQKSSLVRSMLHFVVPATITITLVSLTVYLFYLVSAALDLPPNVGLIGIEFNIPRTALVTILVFCELLLIPFLKPPTNAWTGGEPLSGDWRYTIVAVALLIVYLLILAIPPLRVFFELSPLSLQDCLFLGLVALEWALILRLAWRTRFLDRFLGVDLE
ncbi:MAG: cation-translocating P-type ATPase [Plectolyngbya sp. WJT66-NPBG17]|jgi:cation-transporting ATPase E|nr:cation-translocating P-type ATPase [Plectolyngbya sp. WJT66-NPBG17]MBW4525999.1 cation-translocating P-type ATPase [Phormidium tanganyikae FI6-MK23]